MGERKKPINIGIIGLGKTSASLGYRACLSLLRTPEVGKVFVLNGSSAKKNITPLTHTITTDNTSFNHDRGNDIALASYSDIKEETSLALIFADKSNYLTKFKKARKEGKYPDRRVILKDNLEMFRGISKEMEGYEGLTIIGTNPTDELTYAYIALSGNSAVGLNHTDTMRYKRAVARAFADGEPNDGTVSPKNVSGFMIGPHGLAAMACFSSTMICDERFEDIEKFRGKNGTSIKENLEEAVLKEGLDTLENIDSTADDVCSALDEIVDAFFFGPTAYEEKGVELSTLFRLADYRELIPDLTNKEVEKLLSNDHGTCMGMPVWFRDPTPHIKSGGGFSLSKKEQKGFFSVYKACVEHTQELINKHNIPKISIPERHEPVVGDNSVKNIQERIIGDRITLLSKIGDGSYSVVYKAWDSDLRREVALKIYKPSLTYERAFKKLKTELDSHKNINHPNVLKYYDCIFLKTEQSQHPVPCMVLELAEQDLRAQLNVGSPYSIDEVINSGIQVCKGLQALEKQGLRHRDIKPDNLLRFGDGSIKISDLGSALSIKRTESIDFLSGRTHAGATPSYSGPEGFPNEFRKDDPKLIQDIRSDIYSLGCTLFELATGSPLFSGRTTAEQFTQRKNPPLSESLERSTQDTGYAYLCNILRRALEYYPEDRPTPKQLRDALEVVKHRDILDDLDDLLKDVKLFSINKIEKIDINLERKILETYQDLKEKTGLPDSDLEKIPEFMRIVEKIQERYDKLRKVGKRFVSMYCVEKESSPGIDFAGKYDVIRRLRDDEKRENLRRVSACLRECLEMYDKAARGEQISSDGSEKTLKPDSPEKNTESQNTKSQKIIAATEVNEQQLTELHKNIAEDVYKQKRINDGRSRRLQAVPVTAERDERLHTETAIDHKKISIDDILQGRIFFSDRKKGDKYIGIAVALQQALDFAGDKGYVVTMPELIAAKIEADKNHDLWEKDMYAVHTEENIGIDGKGRFYTANEPVLVVVHGGGILTPERIEQAYEDGSIKGSAKYRNEEFDDLLEGRLPNGDPIQLYTLEELKKGIVLPHRYGIVMPYSIAQATKSGYYAKKEFMENPLVIARAGDMENLEAYFERAKDPDDTIGNFHPFSGRDASAPQGRVLFLDHYGLAGYYDLFDNFGRFVGVAPKARSRARKHNTSKKTKTPSEIITPLQIATVNPKSSSTVQVNLDDILNRTVSKSFHSRKRKKGIEIALRKALNFAGDKGYVVTMPELIAAKLKAKNSHKLWISSYNVHTEENTGIDSKGRFYEPGKPILVIVNGGGILTPDRIRKAHDEGLITGNAKYDYEEFNDLLDGKLPDGTSIELYAFEVIKKGISALPHRFGIVMPYSMVKNTKSTYVGKREFLENPLVIARNAGLQNLEEYFERAKNTDDNTLGCHHSFRDRDTSIPQGRMLSLSNDYAIGLEGGFFGLDNPGLFIAVAPKASQEKSDRLYRKLEGGIHAD